MPRSDPEPEPVIVDDGGSTRIRWRNTGRGDLPKLLNVGDLTPSPRMGSQEEIPDKFTQVQVAYVDKSGIARNVPVTPFKKEIQISSDKDQNVMLKKINKYLEITIYSDVTEPLVEAKQQNQKRRYLIPNSGAIQTVTVDGVLVFDTAAGGGPTTQAGIKRPILYTCVVIT